VTTSRPTRCRIRQSQHSATVIRLNPLLTHGDGLPCRKDWNYGTDRLGNASMGTGTEWRDSERYALVSSAELKCTISHKNVCNIAQKGVCCLSNPPLGQERGEVQGVSVCPAQRAYRAINNCSLPKSISTSPAAQIGPNLPFGYFRKYWCA